MTGIGVFVGVQVIHQYNALANLTVRAVSVAAMLLPDIPRNSMVMSKTCNDLPVIQSLEVTEVQAAANHVVILGLCKH